MGLHQAWTSRTEAEPCDCGLDDDHRVYTLADSEDQLVDYDEPTKEELTGGFVAPLDEEEEAPEGKGFTTT